MAKCRHPNKVAYTSRETAWRAAERTGIGVGAYWCPAGHWHAGHPSGPRRRGRRKW